MSARILLIRHCESSGQWPDAALTDRGRAQAQELIGLLSELAVGTIVSSPYLRARQTIEPFAAAGGLDVGVDPRLVERVLAPTPLDDWRAAVQRSFDDLDWNVPGGESSREAQRRGRAAIDAVLQATDKLTAVVTHGQLLSLVLRSIDGRFGYTEWESLSNPDGYFVDAASDGTLRFGRW